MSERRLRALEALAERGATPGEREAARRALELHRRADMKPRPAQTNRPRPRPHLSRRELLAWIAAHFGAEVERLYRRDIEGLPRANARAFIYREIARGRHVQ